MDQHPIPRQITSFEFKLIGFMTLKQFLYLVIFGAIGFIVYKLFPIPFLNILLGLIVIGFGVALAFLPINDRPLDVWLRNFWRRLNSPTQYIYLKNNPVVAVFSDLFYLSDPHRVATHIESRQMLSNYLISKNPAVKNLKKNELQKVMSGHKTPAASVSPAAKTTVAAPNQPTAAPSSTPQTATGVRQPFLIGMVKNNRKLPLPGILIYIKDTSGNPLRLLKTNPHGVFATYNPLPGGEYTVEIKDPKESYFFDTLKITVAGISTRPIEIFSKELL